MKKKLLLMSHKMNLGGTEKALLSLLGALKEKDVNVTVLLLEGGGALFSSIPNWVKVEVLKDFELMKPIIFDPPLQLIKKNLQEFQLLTAIKNSIRYCKVKFTNRWYLNYSEALKNVETNYKVDMAVAFAGPSDFISYYIVEKVEAPIKYQWIHFDVRKVIFNKNFGNKYYPFFNQLFCVSENSKLIFDQMFPQFASKTTVFKNIISSKQLEEAALIGDTYNDGFKGLRILTLGRLSAEKGQQMIPNIVLKLKQNAIPFKWYLIGEGALTSELNKSITQLGIANELVLLGATLNPYKFIKDCDIYVQTSLHEGYCLTVHEAKVFHKPVIVTNVASASNLIVHNEDGLVVAINEEELYRAVKLVLLNKELRIKFQQNLLAKDTLDEIKKLAL